MREAQTKVEIIIAQMHSLICLRDGSRHLKRRKSVRRQRRYAAVFFVFYMLTNDFQVYILNIYNIVERDYEQISFRRG